MYDFVISSFIHFTKNKSILFVSLLALLCALKIIHFKSQWTRNYLNFNVFPSYPYFFLNLNISTRYSFIPLIYLIFRPSPLFSLPFPIEKYPYYQMIYRGFEGFQKGGGTWEKSKVQKGGNIFTVNIPPLPSINFLLI